MKKHQANDISFSLFLESENKAIMAFLKQFSEAINVLTYVIIIQNKKIQIFFHILFSIREC